MPFKTRQRGTCLVGGSRLSRLGLRDPRLGEFGLRPQPPARSLDLPVGIALVDQTPGLLVAIAQRRGQQFGTVASRRATGDPFESLQQPGPFGLMSRLDADRLDLRPVILEIFAEHVFLLVVEVGEKQGKEVAGTVLEHRLVGRIEGCDHRFEQMHLRILSSRHRRRRSFQEAAIRRAQLCIEIRQQPVDFGTDLRIAIERVNACQCEQHESVVVGVTPRVQNGTVRRQDMSETSAGHRDVWPWPEDSPVPAARSRGRRGTSPSGPPWRSSRSDGPERIRAAARADRRDRPDRAGRQTRPPSRPSLPSTTAARRGRSCEASVSQRCRQSRQPRRIVLQP